MNSALRPASFIIIISVFLFFVKRFELTFDGGRVRVRVDDIEMYIVIIIIIVIESCLCYRSQEG